MMSRITFTSNAMFMKHYLLFILNLFSFRKKEKGKLFGPAIAGYFGISNDQVLLFGSARMGLYTFLKSLRLSPDDEVIVTGYTCVVVTNAIKYLGLSVRYVDIKEDSLNIDTSRLLKEITAKTKAVIVSHNFGIVYEDISLIKERYPHLIIIEDAAHTFSSVNAKGDKVGLLGDASFFSFEFSKPLTTGMGGLLIVNNKDLLKEVASAYNDMKFFPFLTRFKLFITLRAHFLTSYPATIFFKRYMFFILRKLSLQYTSPQEELNGEFPKYYPVRLSATFSYLGYLQIRDIEKINSIKSKIASRYNEYFKTIPGIFNYYSRNFNYVRYPVVLRSALSKSMLHELKGKITSQTGIEVGEWFNDVVHPKGSFRYNYIEGTCPVGESVSERILNFPVSVMATPTDKQLKIIQQLLMEYSVSKPVTN